MGIYRWGRPREGTEVVGMLEHILHGERRGGEETKGELQLPSSTT